jgi:16S rRNA (adenine1518-N6/adenine1519-N6)-dimethyltransferase
MSILAVSVQYYAEPEIIRIVKAGNFWPEPEVDSAIIRLKIKPDNHLPEKEKIFFRIVKAGFSAKRKMLKNNLAGGLKIEPKIIAEILMNNGFNLKARAEELTLADWQKLFAALYSFVV